jgi:hypothetical protein
VYLRLQKHAWRLDIGGPEHVNRQTDHRRFARHETHVNVWRDDVCDGHAVEPWFPLRVEDPTSGILPGDLQAIFEDFCRGSGIQLGPNYRWSDPAKPDETYEEGDVP